jgi:hypothetical protein
MNQLTVEVVLGTQQYQELMILNRNRNGKS